ncbi:hypothetical protein CYLTODRAFT_494237 [Cylindrobasidium torrendii FP15055 ss-10]|uniref:Uncharacterized protein n=1 Tax=Cylindrobasidium torrendii FP15055 ss-10 TaxID=1314674 RepID=A0A0D7AXQ6_9AGAR|nr:hypothetical protein CYLTODRAFT_494237 [Cylindrobasidium torrendii FP15055 ss-10]
MVIGVLRAVGSQVLLPFSGYPVIMPFKKRAMGPIIFVFSISTLIGIAIFNLLTQGHELTSSTVVLQKFYGDRSPLKNESSTTTCQSSLLDVTSSYYTRSDTGSNQRISPGAFKWTINAFDPDDALDTVQGAYSGERLSCFAGSMGLTYYFVGNTYLYGVCAKCELMDRQAATYGGASGIKIFDICSNYNRHFDNWPGFTKSVQNRIDGLMGELSTKYEDLAFAPGELPSEAYEDPSPSIMNRTIEPSMIEFINIWIGDVNYFNKTRRDGSSPPPCHNSEYCSNGTYNVVKTNGQLDEKHEYDDLSMLFNLTGSLTDDGRTPSGVSLPVSGVGSLQPEKAFDGDVSRLPGVLPDLFDNLFALVGYLFDAALHDLDDRALATSFICTEQTSKWKPALSLLAVVLGNSLSVFSVALTVMIAIAAFIDGRLRPSPPQIPLVLRRSKRGSADSTTLSGTPTEALFRSHDEWNPDKLYFGQKEDRAAPTRLSVMPLLGEWPRSASSHNSGGADEWA